MSTRTLRLTSPHMHGSDVEGCQTDLNARLAAWHVPYKLDVDGDWGQLSRDASQSVLYGLGVDKGGDFDGVSPSDRIKIRHGFDRLTKAEKQRHHDRADWRRRLAERYGGGSVGHALEFARKQIGVTEHPAGSNTGPEIDAWEKVCGIHAAPWCGVFVNQVLIAGGFPNQPWLIFCPTIEAHAKAGAGGWSWHTSNPRIGDLPLYGARVAEHVGVVEEIASGIDSATIEGNTSNGPGGSQSNGGIVARRHRHTDGSLNGFPIRGYARPPWK